MKTELLCSMAPVQSYSLCFVMTDFVAYSTCFRMKNCWICRKQSGRQNVANTGFGKKYPCKNKEKKNENQNEIGESFLFNANL